MKSARRVNRVAEELLDILPTQRCTTGPHTDAACAAVCVQDAPYMRSKQSCVLPLRNDGNRSFGRAPHQPFSSLRHVISGERDYCNCWKPSDALCTRKARYAKL